MKRLILILLLLIPVAYADVLEARKASLDYKASGFINQMDAVLNFSSQKSIDATDLSAIKTSFEAKLNEALSATTKEDLKSKEKEMKTLANDFKAKTKEKFKDYLAELKAFVKAKAKKVIAEKQNKADNEIRKIILTEFDKKIAELQAKNNSKINQLLLKEFEKEKLKLNSTQFTSRVNLDDISGKATAVVSGTTNFIKSFASFILEKVKTIEET